MKHTIIFLFLITNHLSAQIKGVVIDSLSGKPISYVNIWVQDENIGSTSEENGEFTIYTTPNKKLIFSALGYEKKITTISNTFTIKLKPTDYQLNEVVILKRYQKKQIEIGIVKSPIYQAFDNGPKIDVKYFPYLDKYLKTKYIKEVSVETDSKIDNATFKLHFYNVDKNGFPSNEILQKDFIVSINKGVKKTYFNLLDFNLKMPKNGIFVGFEKLLIEKNKFQKEIKNYNDNTSKIQTTYYPLVLYNYVQREIQFTFVGGKWEQKQTQNNDGSKQKISVYEPVINLVLTN